MAVTLENDLISVRILEKGAELSSLFNKTNKNEYLWQADAKYWARHAPLLFPIVGKLNNDKTVIKGRPCILTQHGFVRDNIFELCESSSNNALFKFQSNPSTLENYPYEFELFTEYFLNKNSIHITYTVVNPSKENIYFSIGLHPAFNWPLNNGDIKENYYLEFEKNETADRIIFDNGFITGEKTPYLKNQNKISIYDNLFDKDVLIFKNLESQKITLRSVDHSNYLEVNFCDYPYLGIWTKPGNPFICIEPWFGIADNKNSPKPYVDKEGIQKLGSGKSFECSVTYTIG